jgi:hypothetical protein
MAVPRRCCHCLARLEPGGGRPVTVDTDGTAEATPAIRWPPSLLRLVGSSLSTCEPLGAERHGGQLAMGTGPAGR